MRLTPKLFTLLLTPIPLIILTPSTRWSKLRKNRFKYLGLEIKPDGSMDKHLDSKMHKAQ